MSGVQREGGKKVSKGPIIFIILFMSAFLLTAIFSDFSLTQEELIEMMDNNEDIHGRTVKVTISDIERNPMIGYGVYINNPNLMFTSKLPVDAKAGDNVTITVTSYTKMFGVYIVGIEQ